MRLSLRSPSSPAFTDHYGPFRAFVLPLMLSYGKMRTIRATRDNRAHIIKEAVRLLKKGKVMIFPTETVYGIGADAFNKKAVAKIFGLKKRPKTQPLQILIGDIKTAKKVSRNIPTKALSLMKKGWPGPLTVIITKKKIVPDIVTGNMNTVGLRIPDHPLMLEIIKTLGRPIAASSANISGKKPPVTAKEAARYFRSGIALVIDGGKCKRGKASKVIDATGKKNKIIRD